MHPFPSFEKYCGPATRCQPAGSVAHGFRGKVPSELIDLWASEGFCCYVDGLLWTTDPDFFAGTLGEWVDKPNAVVFARTAWGDLYFWDGTKANVLHIWSGKIIEMVSDLSVVFDLSFTAESYLEKALRRPIYQKVLDRLGPLDADECYGFVPAIQLGGTVRPERAQKMKIREHLSILSQL